MNGCARAPACFTLHRVLHSCHEYTRSNTPATETGRGDQGKARWSEQRASQASRRRIDRWSYGEEEAHHERGGEKENCRCAAGEMGEVEAN